MSDDCSRSVKRREREFRRVGPQNRAGSQRKSGVKAKQTGSGLVFAAAHMSLRTAKNEAATKTSLFEASDKSRIRQSGQLPACRFCTRHSANRKRGVYATTFVGRGVVWPDNVLRTVIKKRDCSQERPVSISGIAVLSQFVETTSASLICWRISVMSITAPSSRFGRPAAALSVICARNRIQPYEPSRRTTR